MAKLEEAADMIEGEANGILAPNPRVIIFVAIGSFSSSQALLGSEI